MRQGMGLRESVFIFHARRATAWSVQNSENKSLRISRDSRQPFESTILIAVEDLVAGLARDIEFPAQRRHLLALEQASHEAKSFIHLVTLPPRHFAPPQRPEVLPNVPGMKCYPSLRKGNPLSLNPLAGFPSPEILLFLAPRVDFAPFGFADSLSIKHLETMKCR